MVETEGIHAIIDLEIQKALQKISEAVKGVTKLSKDLDILEKDSKKTGKSLNEMGDQSEGASKGVRDLGNTSSRTSKNLETLSDKADKTGKKTRELGGQSEKSGKDIHALGDTTVKTGKKVHDLGGIADKVGKQILNTSRQIERSDKSFDKLEHSSTKTHRAMGHLINEVKKLRRDMRSLGTQADRTDNKIATLGNRTDRTARKFDLLGFASRRLMIGFAGISAIASGGAFVKFASDIESGFVGVQKTTGLVGQEFEELRNEILKLSSELRGVTVEGLQDISTIAGQLGIRGTQDISRFVEVVAKSAIAMDMTAESAANFLARISNLFHLPTEQLENLASSVNELSNTTTATSEDILNITTRMGGMANVLGLSVQETAALSATMRDVGEHIEVAGSAWVQIFVKMLTNTRGFAKVAGVELSEFSRMIRDEPLEAIKALANRLSELDKTSRAMALEQLGLEGVRVGGVLTKLASNVEILDKNLVTANKSFTDATSLQKEYDVASRTLSAALSQLWNNVKLLSDATVGQLLPGISRAIHEISDLVRQMAGYRDVLDETTQSMFQQSKEVKELATELIELTNKQEKSKKEQQKINEITKQILKILPRLKVEYDELGNVIRINTKSYNDLTKAMNNNTLAAQKNAISELNEQHAQQIRLLDRLQRRIESVQKTIAEGGEDALVSTTRLRGKDPQQVRISAREYLNTLNEQVREASRLRSETFDAIQENQAFLDSMINKGKETKTTEDEDDKKQNKAEEDNKDQRNQQAQTETARTEQQMKRLKSLENETELLKIQSERLKALKKLEQEREKIEIEFTGDDEALAKIKTFFDLQRDDINKEFNEKEAEAAKQLTDKKIQEQKRFQTESIAIQKEILQNEEQTAQLSFQRAMLNNENELTAATALVNKLTDIRKEQAEINITQAEGNADKIAAIQAALVNDLEKIEIDYQQNIRRIKDQQIRESLQLQQQELDFRRTVAENSRDVAIAAGKEQIEAEKDFVAELRSIQDEENRFEMQALDDQLKAKIISEEEYQRERTRIKRDADQEMLRLESDLQRKIAAERERAIREHERSLRRMQREQERSLRRILDPMFSGGDLKDVFGRIFQEEMIDQIARGISGREPDPDNPEPTFLESLFGTGKGNGDAQAKAKVSEEERLRKEREIAQNTKDAAMNTGEGGSIANRLDSLPGRIAQVMPGNSGVDGGVVSGGISGMGDISNTAIPDTSDGIKKIGDTNEGVQDNTKKTVDKLDETKEEIKKLPINMGNIMGAMLGANLFMSDGVTGEGILKTFLTSLAGGFMNFGMAGGFSSGGGGANFNPDFNTGFIPSSNIGSRPLGLETGFSAKGAGGLGRGDDSLGRGQGGFGDNFSRGLLNNNLDSDRFKMEPPKINQTINIPKIETPNFTIKQPSQQSFITENNQAVSNIRNQSENINNTFSFNNTFNGNVDRNVLPDLERGFRKIVQDEMVNQMRRGGAAKQAIDRHTR